MRPCLVALSRRRWRLGGSPFLADKCRDINSAGVGHYLTPLIAAHDSSSIRGAVQLDVLRAEISRNDDILDYCLGVLVPT